MTRTTLTPERERELDRFVQNEVHLNVSALVARLVELGDDEDIPVFIFSWYAVSGWLADELEAQGETVVRDFYGLDLWGRAVFGQAISMDGVIQTIYDNLHKSTKEA